MVPADPVAQVRSGDPVDSHGPGERRLHPNPCPCCGGRMIVIDGRRPAAQSVCVARSESRAAAAFAGAPTRTGTGESKLANILFARELARRLEGTGVNGLMMDLAMTVLRAGGYAGRAEVCCTTLALQPSNRANVSLNRRREAYPG